MALTEAQIQEIESVKSSMNSGITGGDRKSRLLSQVQAIRKPKATGFMADIKGIGTGIVESGKERLSNIGETFEAQSSGEQNLAESVFQTIGQGAGFLSDVVGETVVGGLKAATPQGLQEKAGDVIESGAEKIADTSFAQEIMERYNNLDEETQRNLDAVLGITSLASEFVGGSAVKQGLKRAKGAVDDVLTARNIARSFEEPVESTAEQTARATAQTKVPKVSLKEKAIGLTPAEKAVISGKSAKTKSYIDTAKTRNMTKNAPTVMEFAGDQARKAADEMENVLNNKGAEIGATRSKLSTVKAPVDSVSNIENTFKQQLDDLNLTLKNDNIIQKKGVVSRVGTNSDINTMNDIWNQFKIVKQSPTAANLIDFRNLVQKNIDFGKSAREVSDALNRPATQIRKSIKTELDNLVGKTGANDLQKYTDFIEAFNDIKEFTDKNAGGEYLLRVLESGRGGQARKVVNTIKEYTGIDLQEDATLLKLVTNLIADADQKTLFSQQITNAGVDAARILSGDKGKLFEKTVGAAIDTIADPEKVLLEASR